MSIRPLTTGMAVGLLMMVLAGRAAAGSVEATPLATRNQNPLIAVFGLPAAEPAGLLPAGRSSLRLDADAANSYVAGSGAGERIVLDGETWRLNLAMRHGLNDRVELGIDIPVVYHTGGIFDGLIDGWHSLLGLSGSGRDTADGNALDYRYTRNGLVLAAVDDPVSGLGDIRLSGAVRIGGSSGADGRSLALHAGIKLPTGDSDRLTGSGAVDVSLSVAGSDRFRLPCGPVAIFGSAGMVMAGSGRVLGRQQRHLAGFGTMGLGWRPMAWLVPKIQMDWHSPLYRHSRYDAIDAWSAQLGLGTSIVFSEDAVLDVAIVEDIAVNTAPDAVFHLSFRKRF